MVNRTTSPQSVGTERRSASPLARSRGYRLDSVGAVRNPPLKGSSAKAVGNCLGVVSKQAEV